MNPEARRQRFFGALQMAIGGLIATLCGLCSLSILANSLMGFVGSLVRGYGLYLGPLVAMLFMVLVVGGLPTWLGFAIFRSGLRMRAKANPKIDVSTFGDGAGG